MLALLKKSHDKPRQCIKKQRHSILSKMVHLVKAMVFPVVMYGCESWTIKKVEWWRTDAFELWCWEDSWESFGQQGDQTNQSQRKSNLNIHWKDWCWSWSSNTLATWCKEVVHWKRPQCWERLKAEGEGDNRRQDGLMASPTQWTWVWANSRRQWKAGKPGMLQSMGSQRVRHDWATEQLPPPPPGCFDYWSFEE